MIKIGIVYGSIAGLIVICSMVTGIVLSGGEGALSSQWLGYLVMILALSMIYFGVKRYRDRERGGVISFGQALLMGVFIAGVAGAAYVIVWEIYLVTTDYAFIDDYTAGILEQKEAEGLAGDALAAEIANMEALKAQYANPLFRLPMTFVEIFPVGLLVSLISAGLLRTSSRS